MKNRINIRAIDGELIRKTLTPDICIDLMDKAMRKVSLGEAELPLRWGMRLPNGNGALGMMPGYISEPECFGIKLVSLFPGNSQAGLPSHMGLMVLFEAGNGQPVALLDGNVITAIRTGAASALATRELARPGASRLAILGAGEQALSHVPHLLAVREIRSIALTDRDHEKAKRVADALTRQYGVMVEARKTVRATVKNADIICTLTTAAKPILKADWISDGAHLNLVGSSHPECAEVDTATVVRGRFFVDYRKSTLDQAGEFLKAMDEGQIGTEHICGEIGQVLLGEVPGRQSADEVTIYKSLGIAAQDLVAAEFVYRMACHTGQGAVVEM